MKKFFFFIAFSLLMIGAVISSGKAGFSWQNFNFSLPKIQKEVGQFIGQEQVRVVSEESVVIDVVKKVSPSVVTVGIR